MKKIIGLFLLLLAITAISAESQIISHMELYNTLYRGRDNWYFTPAGKTGLSFRSSKNNNVQGHSELEFFPQSLYSETGQNSLSALNIKKAFIRTRFPGMRLTLGKTRLAWGQGAVFNAGDVIFGSLNPLLDLSQTELRSDTAWLSSVNVPLGHFSFLEGVVLPPAVEQESDGSLTVPGIDKSSIGGRLYFLAGGVKFEAGYLYKGQTMVAADALGHRPYISLQGNIGPDWYLSSSLAIATKQQQSEDMAGNRWEESWNLTLGFFHMQEINRNNTVNLRLETLFFPYQNWENQSIRASIYGVYLYPEITWTTGSGSSYSLQSVISPLDSSAMITAGAGWNIYQGLFLVAYTTFFMGDDDATFAWNPPDDIPDEAINGISLMTGLRYTF